MVHFNRCYPQGVSFVQRVVFGKCVEITAVLRFEKSALSQESVRRPDFIWERFWSPALPRSETRQFRIPTDGRQNAIVRYPCVNALSRHDSPAGMAWFCARLLFRSLSMR